MLKKLIGLLPLTAAAALPQPNIVFVLVDDMSWTGLSARMQKDNPKSASDFFLTPNIDRLAKSGMRFSNAYSPGPMCTPSRAGILTGKTPAELHMTTPGGGRPQNYQKLRAPRTTKDLPTSEKTIPELLKGKGYATAHFGKWHLGTVDPDQHGFDLHDGCTANTGPGLLGDPNPKDIFGITRRAVAFMEDQVESTKPFYLQLSHYAVHSPTEALEKSKETFARLPVGERHANSEFAAMTHDLDTSIDTLLCAIDRLRLADNTYVVLMSDNGGPGNPRHSMNLPLNGGKGSLYEGGIRVPLIVRGPGIEAGSFCSETVTGCDLLPTFCEWASAPHGKIAGTSLIPLLTGRNNAFRRDEASLLFHCPHYGKGPRQKPQSALILGNHKLLKDLESGTVQLFDLSKDLPEKNDLSQRLPEKANELEALLARRLEQVDAQTVETNPDYDPTAKPTRRKR